MEEHGLRSKSKILVIEPHPDDGALSMGATIRKYYEEGYELYSIVVFSETEKSKRKIRKIESDTVWKHELSGKVFYLDFPDETFYEKVGEHLKINNVTKLIYSQCLKLLNRKIGEIDPDIIYFPFGIGGHFHHIIVNMCFDILYVKYNKSQLFFYEDYPYSDLSKVTYAKYIYKIWKNYVIQEEYNAISGYIEQKAKIISTYSSQVENEFNEVVKKLNDYHIAIGYEGLLKGMELDINKPYERLWRVISRKNVK